MLFSSVNSGTNNPDGPSDPIPNKYTCFFLNGSLDGNTLAISHLQYRFLGTDFCSYSTDPGNLRNFNET